MEFEDSDEVSSDKGSKGMEDSVSESDSSVGSIMAERDSRALVVASPVIDRIAFMAFRMLSRISSLSGDSLKNLKVAACERLDGVRSMVNVCCLPVSLSITQTPRDSCLMIVLALLTPITRTINRDCKLWSGSAVRCAS